MKPIGVIILGKVGSGKGTLAKNMAGELRYHLSGTGDLCRDKMKDESFCLEYAEKMSERDLIPNDVIIKIIKEDVFNAIRNTRPKGLVLEGFPRNHRQAEDLSKLVYELSFGAIPLSYWNTVVIELELSSEKCIDRILNDPNRSHRTDVNEAKSRKSILMYEKYQQGIMERVQKLGYRYYKVSSDQKPEEIFGEVKETLGIRAPVVI